MEPILSQVTPGSSLGTLRAGETDPQGDKLDLRCLSPASLAMRLCTPQVATLISTSGQHHVSWQPQAYGSL